MSGCSRRGRLVGGCVCGGGEGPGPTTSPFPLSPLVRSGCASGPRATRTWSGVASPCGASGSPFGSTSTARCCFGRLFCGAAPSHSAPSPSTRRTQLFPPSSPHTTPSPAPPSLHRLRVGVSQHPIHCPECTSAPGTTSHTGTGVGWSVHPTSHTGTGEGWSVRPNPTAHVRHVAVCCPRPRPPCPSLKVHSPHHPRGGASNPAAAGRGGRRRQ